MAAESPSTLPPDVEARQVAALGLARQGFAITHVYGVRRDGRCSCGDPHDGSQDPAKDAKSVGKHGGKGWLEQATTDPNAIRTRFLRGEPNYGVVPPTGSGLLIVDEDAPGGLDALGPLPATLTVRTGPKPDGSRGRHIYGRLPAGIDEAGVPYQWSGGEVRVHGNGQAVGPYSRHHSGAVYEPLNGGTAAELPESWVRALIASGRQKVTAQSTARSEADPGWFVEEPGRHPWLVAKARWLRGNGLSGQRLRDELRRLNTERCRPPKPDPEVDEIADWTNANIGDDPPGVVLRFDTPEPSRAEPEAWPDPPANAAYHGVLGDMALAVAPHTEADPVGVLGTLLAMFGASCGDGRAFYQGSLQRTNLSILLVGGTGFSGRKGTALDVSRSCFRLAYPALDGLWLVGVASGEAITGHLGRDVDGRPRYETEPRVLIVEPEFGRVLTIMNRDGSTLSPVLRNAWDGVPLGHARARDESLVTRHHVSMLGHVTPIELRAKLTEADAGNGFANRILFLAVRRSRLIPFPKAPDELIRQYVGPLRLAIVEAQAPGEMELDEDARDRWESFYAELALTPRLGLAGAVTGRHEAQVARLALVYALADRSPMIGVDHLDAAIAIAEYARRSAAWALGDSTGNRHADVLLRMLADGEVGWDDAKRSLGLRTAADMAEAVAVLIDAGLAELVPLTPATGGRPRRVLRAKGAKGAKDARGARTETQGIST